MEEGKTEDIGIHMESLTTNSTKFQVKDESSRPSFLLNTKTTATTNSPYPFLHTHTYVYIPMYVTVCTLKHLERDREKRTCKERERK